MQRRTALAALLAALGLGLAGAQTTELEFASRRSVPLYLVEEPRAEASGSLASDLDLAAARLRLVGFAPGTIELPEGDYLVNVGGFEEFNRTIAVRARGERLRFELKGDPRKARAFAYVAALGSAALVSSIAPLVQAGGEAETWLYAGLAISGGAASAVGLAGMLLEAPRVLGPR